MVVKAFVEVCVDDANWVWMLLKVMVVEKEVSPQDENRL